MSIIDDLRRYRVGTEFVSWHPEICDRAADYITDLLARAEAAEARAEKAERERDEFKGKYIEAVNRACELSKIVEENGLEE